jgi:predicted PurR-regulated permease PerM
VLAPVVDRVVEFMPMRRARPDLALGLAVGWVYAVALLLVILAGIEIIPRMGDQAAELVENVPTLVERARSQFEKGSSWYRERVPPPVQQQIDRSTQDIAVRLAGVGEQVIERSVSILTGGVTALLAYIVVPFWLFYVLKDRDRMARAFYGLFPISVRDDVRVLAHQANRVLGSYIRAQLLLSAVSGVVTAVGLSVLHVQFSLILGVIAGIANLIPVLGPMIGGFPALVVTLATQPGWPVLWVFLFLFVAQNLKDYILVPRIQGNAVKLHPAIILVLLVIAGHLAGFWGLLVVVPVAAVLRDIFVYVYRRLGDEPQSPEELEALSEARAVPIRYHRPEPSDPAAVGED